MAVIPTRDFKEDRFLVFATAQGQIKKTELLAYNTKIGGRDHRDQGPRRRARAGAPDLRRRRHPDGLEVRSRLALQRIRRAADGPRHRRRQGMNVAGKVNGEQNRVLAMDIARDDAELFVVVENGYGKRTAVTRPGEGRGTKGVLTAKLTEKKGGLAGAMIVREYQDLLFISQNGMVQRTNAGGISQMGRATQGVRSAEHRRRRKVSAVALVVERPRTRCRGRDRGRRERGRGGRSCGRGRPAGQRRRGRVADLWFAESGLPEEGGGPNSHA